MRRPAVCVAEVDGLVVAGALAGTAVGLKDLLPHAERLRGDFDEFVVSDELDALLKSESLERDETDSII